MNILVCIKQVPDTTEIRIDPVTNTLIREGVPSIVNTFDAYALETAVRIKDVQPSTKIVVASMGPPQAQVALKECLSIGADKAYLVSDRAFGGSDTLATSYILSSAVGKMQELEGEFDLIFCGKQAIDGDTAQVGPELAEHLGLPQITYAIEASVEGEEVLVKRECYEGYEILAAKLPCLVTVTKPAYEPRKPSIKSKMAATRAVITTLTAQDLTIDLTKAGLGGSPTKVKKTFTPPRKTGGIMIEAENHVQAANELFGILQNARLV